MAIEVIVGAMYISGPITTAGGSVEENIKRFSDKEIELKVHGFSVFNPACVEDSTWMQYDYMNYYIHVVLPVCSAMYMLKGWEHSKGACIEHEYAVEHDMTIIYE
jgi:hypothetical protein